MSKISLITSSVTISSALEAEEVEIIKEAGLLHDIGKIHVDEALLHKPNVSAYERELIRFGHIEGTKAILSEYFDPELVRLASHHHERLNSSGYPEHLNATKLDILDRILQVADVTSALAQNRSYQGAYEPQQAIEILEKSGKKFENKVQWGMDLNSEHERYICEEVVGGPVFLTDYPKEIKAFYMRLNDDNKTVAACDLLVPGIGELVGGSQREERYDVLNQIMDEKGMAKESLQWYMDLRRFGGCKHAGFGLGFDRFLMYLTGVGNIRDTEPFPRTTRNLIF